MKQTAVEWLIDKLTEKPINDISDEYWFGIMGEAKEMEKEQIMMAVKDSWYMAKGSNFQEPQEEQYYIKEYGGDK